MHVTSPSLAICKLFQEDAVVISLRRPMPGDLSTTHMGMNFNQGPFGGHHLGGGFPSTNPLFRGSLLNLSRRAPCRAWSWEQLACLITAHQKMAQREPKYGQRFQAATFSTGGVFDMWTCGMSATATLDLRK